MSVVKKKITRKKSSKKAAKRKIIKKLSPQDIKPAEYNPRIMDDDTKKALKVSMSEFQDISGITWNKTTSNIITGHHRWANLIDAYGEENLEFKDLGNDRHSIFSEEKDTGFVLRVVEWDEIKEKQANITANSESLSGRFTADLQDLLEEIKIDMDDDLFSGLRLDDLELQMDDDDDDVWETDITEVENTESNLDGIITTIKVECAQEMRSDVFALINTLIKKEGLSNKVQIK